jgi:hypothetical protein
MSSNRIGGATVPCADTNRLSAAAETSMSKAGRIRLHFWLFILQSPNFEENGTTAAVRDSDAIGWDWSNS